MSRKARRQRPQPKPPERRVQPASRLADEVVESAAAVEPDVKTPEPRSAEPAKPLPTAKKPRLRWAGPVLADVFALAVVCLLLLIQFKWLLCYPLGYDDSYNSLIAKNLANGEGYASVYGGVSPDGVYRIKSHFPYDVTTGPALLVPAAAFIRVFGNRYWTPGLAVVICSLTALLACFFLLRRHAAYRSVASLAFGVTLLLTVVSYLKAPGGYFVVFFQLYGEWFATVLLVCGNILVFGWGRASGRIHGAVFAYAGCAAFAAAMLTKTMAAAPVAVALAIFIAITLRERWEASRDKWLVLSAAAVVPAAWWGVGLLRRIVIGDPALLQRIVEAAAGYYAKAGSGVRELADAPDKFAHLSQMSAANWDVLVEWFGGQFRLALLTILIVAAVAASLWILWQILARRRASGPLALPAVLTLSGAALWTWWVALSPLHLSRHLLIAILPLFLGILLLVCLAPRRFRMAAAVAYAAPFALFLQFSYPTVEWFVRDVRHGWQQSPNLAAAVEAARFLDGLKARPNVVLLGCGTENSGDLDYLMRATGNVRNCIGWTNPDPQRNELYLLSWRDWGQAHGPEMGRIQQRCTERVYRREWGPYAYTVMRCPQGITRLDRP